MAKRRSRPPRTQRTSAKAAMAMVDAPSRRLAAAASLWRENRFNDAIELYEEAIRREPNNVRTYVSAARAYAEKCDFDRMEKTHDKLSSPGAAPPGRASLHRRNVRHPEVAGPGHRQL